MPDYDITVPSGLSGLPSKYRRRAAEPFFVPMWAPVDTPVEHVLASSSAGGAGWASHFCSKVTTPRATRYLIVLSRNSPWTRVVRGGVSRSANHSRP